MTGRSRFGLKNPSPLPLNLVMSTPTHSSIWNPLHSPFSSAAYCCLCCRVLSFFHLPAAGNRQRCSAAAQFPRRAHALPSEAARIQSGGHAGKQRSQRLRRAREGSLLRSCRAARRLRRLQRAPTQPRCFLLQVLEVQCAFMHWPLLHALPSQY